MRPPLDPVLFLDGVGYFAGKISKGKMAVASINTMLVDYALPFALFVYTAKMQRGSFSSHILLVVVLAVVMLVPYFLSLLFSRFLFQVACRTLAVRAVSVGMPNFAAIGLPLLHAVYGEQSDLPVALAIATASVVMSPAALILLEHSRNACAPLSLKPMRRVSLCCSIALFLTCPATSNCTKPRGSTGAARRTVIGAPGCRFLHSCNLAGSNCCMRRRHPVGPVISVGRRMSRASKC
ncbi:MULTISPECIES: AEC family transporter [Paraburkholderia]|uniref:AEC family transporter n=1 Tax=Paraburkholderia TaxID=1822464 RepID=UPI0038BDAD92